MRVLQLALILWIGGCGGKTTTDTIPTTGASAGTPSGVNVGVPVGGATGTGTGTTSTNLGLLSRVGSAVVDGSYDGTEAWWFVGDEGYGDTLCHITYDLDGAKPRPGCKPCDWAYTVTVSNAQLVTDSGSCLSVVGYDAKTVDTLNGTTFGIGYDPDYVGHAQILMFDDGSGWAAGSYALWDDKAKTFDYDWVDGLHAY